MKDLERALGDFIDRRSVSFISSTDDEGCPVIRAMLAPSRRRGIGVRRYGGDFTSEDFSVIP